MPMYTPLNLETEVSRIHIVISSYPTQTNEEPVYLFFIAVEPPAVASAVVPKFLSGSGQRSSITERPPLMLNQIQFNIRENYQDANAIVNEEGKPDIFMTFTCNPSW